MTDPSGAHVLQALANGGIRAVPASHFPQAAAECDAHARATGDARFPVLQQVLLEAFTWWDERGGIPRAIADKVSQLIMEQLPDVLRAESARDGYVLATGLAKELRRQMTDTDDWIERGYVAPPDDR